MPTSNDTSEHIKPPEAVKRYGRRVPAALAFAWHLVTHHWGLLLLVFLFIGVPLWAFGELAEEVLEGPPLFGDVELLQFLRSVTSPTADRVFLFFSEIGYAWGVIPIDIALVLLLAFKRRWRSAAFALVAIGGSALLNMAAKQSFRRDRPALWESIAPEPTYSFPSGHAMGSATLAFVLIALAWTTRWRWPVVVVALMFMFGVGMSRVYLGVHYPSDILAGWAAAIAWTIAVYMAFFRRNWHEWRPRV